MTELERQEYINQFWKPFNSLYSDVKNEYEINILTKHVRNSATGNLCNWIDNGTASLGRRVELMKDNGKVSSYHESKVRNQCRLIWGM